MARILGFGQAATQVLWNDSWHVTRGGSPGLVDLLFALVGKGF